MIETERKRPIKQFVVVVAHGPYRKGDRIQPTGMYRSQLLARGVIKEVVDEPQAAPAALDNRMLDLQSESPPLANRGPKRQRS